jgi:BioD-like phosphotransacetylase family protein
MIAVYVASTEGFAGKTSVAISLAKHLRRDGFAVGYIKPLTIRVEPSMSSTGESAALGADSEAVARDVEFISQELDLSSAPEDLTPLILTPALIESEIQAGQPTDFRSRLLAAYERIAQDRDVVLVEGVGHPLEGSLFDLSSPQVAELFDARVLVVVRYADNLSLDVAAGLRTIYGGRLMGLVVNDVPRTQLRSVSEVRSALERRNLPVFAVLPEDRLLSSISVRELVDQMHGEVLCCPDQADGLIEYLMVGAMTAGSALSYFRLRPNKAVITGGDHALPDLDWQPAPEHRGAQPGPRGRRTHHRRRDRHADHRAQGGRDLWPDVLAPGAEKRSLWQHYGGAFRFPPLLQGIGPDDLGRQKQPGKRDFRVSGKL